MIGTVISLAAAGVLLMFLEMFLPGIIAGVVGGILLFSSVVVAYRELGTEAGNLVLLAAVAVTGGMWWWWATKFQHTRFGRSMTLMTSSTGEAGLGDQLASLHSQIGTAMTPLRPSGTVLVAGQRVDAITAGEFLDAGTRVRVIRTHGLGVLVRQGKLAGTVSLSVRGMPRITVVPLMNSPIIPLLDAGSLLNHPITIGIVFVSFITVALVLFSFLRIWIRARLAGTPVNMINLIAMRLRGVPVGQIVDAHVTATKAGLGLDTDQIEAHYLAGGNVNNCIIAVIAAAKQGIALDWNRACAIDLAMKGTANSVLEAFKTAINPQGIDSQP